MIARRLSTVLALLLVALASTFARAHADPGSGSDPDDTAGPLDVKVLSHENDDTTITYRLEFSEPVRLADVWTIRWEFDFNGDDNTGDACIVFSRLGSTDTLRGSLAAECGPEVWATTDARFVADNAIEMTLQLIDLVECCGLKSGSYSYQVTTLDHDRVEDHAPEGTLVRHDGIEAPDPRPGSQETVQGSSGDDAPSGFLERVGSALGTAISKVGGGVSGAFVFAARGLCAGPSCITLGLLAPVIAAFVAWPVLRAIRRRQERPDAENGPVPRSQPGNTPFNSTSAPGDSVQPRAGRQH